MINYTHLTHISQRSTDYIFENNRQWVSECLSKDPDTFRKLSKSQQPRYMYIGCSDSRVPAQNMMVSNFLLVLEELILEPDIVSQEV